MKPKLTALTVALAALLAVPVGGLPAAALAAPQPAAPQASPAVATEMLVRPAGARIEAWSKHAPATPAGESLADPVAEEPQAAPSAPAAPVTPPPSGEPAPADPAPEPEAPAEVEPEAPVEPEPAPAPSEPAGGDTTATATNDSLTFQVLVQVQRGCRSYCHATSQTQVADQIAQTTQEASAETGPEGGDALAANRSRTLQFVWQAQLGCVAFCYGTSQLQQAGQRAQTDQTATASAAAATALNQSYTGQYAFQLQRGCVDECHASAQAQALAQEARTVQSADAAATGDDEADLEELRSAFGGIEAWARNLNATVQFAFQFQDADCRQDCHGDVQAQWGAQQAATAQHATATSVAEGRAPSLE